jgi:bacillithiol biosynthesis cysteine-adding enzyme BshC
MNSKAEYIAYASTNSFSKIVIDYIDGNALLKPFFKHDVSLQGIENAIIERQQYPTNRKLLVDVLQKQYASTPLTQKQQFNIEQLANENCFTITTAHQPNIFTGHLYFVYKILHAIKLAAHLKTALPENNFVPVYYMGSEDADLEELNHIYIKGEKYEWQTNQTGAVGRMKVDKALIDLIDKIAGQLLVEPFGEEIINGLKNCYKLNSTIEQSTFLFVNYLFAKYGLLIVLPDNTDLKRSFIPIVEKELTEQFSHKAVVETVKKFPAEYKVQAGGREVNLFYLIDDKRDRIEKVSAGWSVVNSLIKFTDAEILTELNNFPERFSANVILRPVFQEMILPSIAFIGGGGEIAYWLELKKVFEAVGVPYPTLILRNSFLLVDENSKELINKLKLSTQNIFQNQQTLIDNLVKSETGLQLSLQTEIDELNNLYQKIKSISTAIDVSLTKHTEALHKKATNKLIALQKKMLKAEKKKFEAQIRQIQKLKNQLFPTNNLQERIENFLPYYAKWGSNSLNELHTYSLPLESKFTSLFLH